MELEELITFGKSGLATLYYLYRVESTQLNPKKQKRLTCINQIARNIYITYPNVFRSIHLLEEIGLVETNKTGRERHVNLTQDGRTFVQRLVQAMNVLKKKHIISEL
jgi:DNA-binding MarR family transcriptional regulator